MSRLFIKIIKRGREGGRDACSPWTRLVRWWSILQHSDTRERELLALQADVSKAWSCQDSVPGATVRHVQ